MASRPRLPVPLPAVLRNLPGSAAVALRGVAVRFPLVCLWALVLTVAAWQAVVFRPGLPSVWPPLLMVSALGLPVSLAAALFAEREGRAGRWAGLALGLFVPAAYALTLPFPFTAETPSYHGLRFLILAISAHLAVAVAPYLRRRERNGFWQFNRSLLLRIGAAAFFSLVIALGLTSALFAVEALFDVAWPAHTTARVWAVTFGLFNTAFFLAGVPRDYEALDLQTGYPRGLDILARFILLPLTGLYLVILYGYLLRIALEAGWPEGQVSALIIGFSSVGILTLLLLHPQAQDAPRLRAALRAFPAVLLPLAIVLVLAVWQRVEAYGMTELRYLGWLLAAWLGGIAVYLLATRGQEIKAIPLSLGVLLVAAAFGPWGMFATSEASQRGRLAAMLQEAGAQQGQVAPVSVRTDRYYEIVSVAHYLEGRHGPEALAGVLPAADETGEPVLARVNRRVSALVARPDGLPDVVSQWVTRTLPAPAEYVDLRPYEGASLLSWTHETADRAARVGAHGATLAFDAEQGTLVLRRGEEVERFDLVAALKLPADETVGWEATLGPERFLFFLTRAEAQVLPSPPPGELALRLGRLEGLVLWGPRTALP